MPKKNSTAATPAVVEKSESEIMIANDDAKFAMETLQENFGPKGIQLKNFTKVKVPSQGVTTWFYEDIGGKQSTEQIVGVVLFTAYNRAYHKIPYEDSGGGSPPDCSSFDGITGEGNPGGSCIECPFDKFGSAPARKGKATKAKACNEFRLMFLVPPQQLLPIIVKVPTMSLENIEKYLVGLSSFNLRTYHVITELTLREATSSAGLKYSQVHFKKISELAPDEKARTTEYAQAIRPYMEKAMIELHKSGSSMLSQEDLTNIDPENAPEDVPVD